MPSPSCTCLRRCPGTLCRTSQCQRRPPTPAESMRASRCLPASGRPGHRTAAGVAGAARRSSRSMARSARPPWRRLWKQRPVTPSPFRVGLPPLQRRDWLCTRRTEHLGAQGAAHEPVPAPQVAGSCAPVSGKRAERVQRRNRFLHRMSLVPALQSMVNVQRRNRHPLWLI